MKVVILAGGLGSRISEESLVKPKPMIEIGNKPILWHIMKIYSYYGFNDFLICLGYKGNIIKKYFADYYLSKSDVSYDVTNNKISYFNNSAEPWTVTLVNTGHKSMTGGRIKRISDYLDDETFCMTYGDGLSNVNIINSIKSHKNSNALCTLTAVKNLSQFGVLTFSKIDTRIIKFNEKPIDNRSWINGGFFVMEPKVIDYIDNDFTIWEKSPMQKLANEGKLCAYKHNGFWQNMDTLHDKIILEELWSKGNAPWKLWSK